MEVWYGSHIEITGTDKTVVFKFRSSNTLTLDSKGNYSATSNNTQLVHWTLMGGLLHLVQRGGA